jgi:hypothetical protein
MSDDTKSEAKVQQHDEPGDEVEGHSKHDAKIDAKVERPGVTDDGDEVEAHKVEKVEGRSDEKMV